MLNKIRIFHILSIIGLIFINSGDLFSQTNAKFQTARAFDGGNGYATADFNGDGKLDVVSIKPNSINVSLGDGSGVFNPLPNPVFFCFNFYSSNETNEPLAGDFNGDGKADIAVWVPNGSCTGIGERGLMLLPGNGNGSFAVPVIRNISNFFFTPNQFLTADFNGDGRLDVAFGSSFLTGGDKLGIFLSSGSGFAEPVTYDLGGQALYGLSVGDFNNDQRADVVYSRRSPKELSLLPNSGNGTFGAPQTISSTNFDYTISPAGDFNNDGKLDFATLQTANSLTQVQLWQGNGNNTFTPGPLSTIDIGNAYIGLLLPGDYNRDGRLDLALAGTGRILVYRGNANGTFSEDEVYAVGGGRLLKGDFNNDGWTDLLAQQIIGDFTGAAMEFAILKNLQNGKFLSSPFLELSSGGQEVAVADFNNDGLKDIALTGDASEGEVLLLLQESGRGKNESFNGVKFNSANRKALGIEGISPQSLAVGDFNNDGKNDVVVGGRSASGTGENVLVATNDGAGNLSIAATLTLGRIVAQIVPGDYNADGKLDLAFAVNPEMTPNTVPTVSVAFGSGNGSFAAPVGYLTNLIAVSLTKGDFNGDGKLDLAVAHSNSKITVLTNNGSGNFSAGTPFDTAFSPTEIAAADLTGDGKQDLIVAHNAGFNENNAVVSVFAGNGSGTFVAPANYKTAGLQKQRLAIDDFNGDSKPDVAVTNGGVITMLMNNGSGVLTQRTLWGHAGSLVDIASGDLNNDQKIDFVTTSIISTISNFSCLSFSINETPQSNNRSAKFDFDGDGKSDVSVFRPENGSWYIQQSQAGFIGLAFGLATDKLAPADFDGDGKTDVAVVRNGTWYLQRSQAGFTGITFGDGNDIPVPADYDGDGKSEIAVFRPSNGYWYILNLVNNQFTATLFGQNGDKPVAADYDGDGKSDIAVNRNGNWYINRSQLGFTGIAFGDANDKSVPADYDGDGKADVAVFRPSNGTWYLLQSTAGFVGTTFGLGTDIPVAADYDGDGKADIAVVRNGNWYLNRTTQGFTGTQFGTSTDKPIPNAFVK